MIWVWMLGESRMSGPVRLLWLSPVVWFACSSPVLRHCLALFSSQLFPLLWWGAHWSTQSYWQNSALGEAYVPASSFLHSYYLLKGEFPSCHLGRQWSWEPGQMSGCCWNEFKLAWPRKLSLLEKDVGGQAALWFPPGGGDLLSTASEWDLIQVGRGETVRWTPTEMGSSDTGQVLGVVRGPERVISTSLSFVPLPVGNAAWTLCDISLNPFCVYTTSHIYVFNTNWFQNTLVNYTAIWSQVLFQNIFRVKIFEWYDAFMVWRKKKKKKKKPRVPLGCSGFWSSR